MKPVIKAIQTKYKGYRFRSRLEARWAVFFDSCGIKWVYEPEGFLLNNGESYLPDFYLPGENIYAEVKADSGDFRKAKLFCETTQNHILLLEGVPELKYYDTFTYGDEDYPSVTEDTFREFFDIWVKDGEARVVLNGEGPDSAWWDRSDITWVIHSYARYASDFKTLETLGDGFKKVEEAVKKARGARFEFGENGE
jgi:hypothetical protein